jgi:hypothetical protein
MGARISSGDDRTDFHAGGGATGAWAPGERAMGLSRKIEWRPRGVIHMSAFVSEFTQAGPARHVVATHLGGAEKVSYADI